MAKSILYRWFGLRKIPLEVRSRVQHEGTLFDEEGISCALSYKNFRGPRNASERGRESAAVGSLLITQKTFYIQFPYLILCDKPLEEAVLYFEMELEGSMKLLMKFEVEKLFGECSGDLSCHWRTENAESIFNYLSALQQKARRDS